MVKDVAAYIEQHYDYWNRSGGTDHIFLISEDHGYDFSLRDTYLSSQLLLSLVWISAIFGPPGTYIKILSDICAILHNRSRNQILLISPSANSRWKFISPRRDALQNLCKMFDSSFLIPERCHSCFSRHIRLFVAILSELSKTQKVESSVFREKTGV